MAAGVELAFASDWTWLFVVVDFRLWRLVRQHKGNRVMKHLITRLLRENDGQDLIEYALLAAFLSLVAAGGAVMVGTSLDTWYQNLSGTIDGMASTP